MWRLIKAELRYRVVFLAPACGVILTLLLGLSAVPALLYLPDVPFHRKMAVAFVALFYLATFCAFSTLYSPHGALQRERRLLLHARLTLGPRQLGVVRGLVLVLEWALFVGVLLLGVFLAGDGGAFRGDDGWSRSLMALTGVVFAGSAWRLILDDLGVRFADRFKGNPGRLSGILTPVAVSTTILFLAVFCYALSTVLPGAAHPMSRAGTVLTFVLASWEGAGTLLTGGCAMLMASVRTFEIRRSFLG